MRFGTLGKSGIKVSAIGTGTWAMGGDFFGAIDEKQCIEAIVASLDAGVNLVDTAPVYGHGHSEELVGPRRSRAAASRWCSAPSAA